jgi:hypothetical protein
MYKCIHGHVTCSECHNPLNGDSIDQNEFEKMVHFNNHCAALMGYRRNWRFDTHYWILPTGEEILQTDYNPYQDMAQLASVVDNLTNDGDVEELVANIIKTTVRQAFREFVLKHNIGNA